LYKANLGLVLRSGSTRENVDRNVSTVALPVSDGRHEYTTELALVEEIRPSWPALGKVILQIKKVVRHRTTG